MAIPSTAAPFGCDFATDQGAGSSTEDCAGRAFAARIDRTPDERAALRRSRAGLGFLGKHGCLIVPGLGSYVLLGLNPDTLAIEVDGRIRSGRVIEVLSRLVSERGAPLYALASGLLAPTRTGSALPRLE